MNPFLKVFLRSTAGEVELSTLGYAGPFKLLDGARGLGVPTRSVESTPIPAGNGSVFRSQRFDESEVMLPVAIRDKDASLVATRARELEKALLLASDEPIELVVEAPDLSTVRRRWVYYTDGLEGALGGSDSHFTWRHMQIKFIALDPIWYGEERKVSKRVSRMNKPFLTAHGDGSGMSLPFFPVILADSTVAGSYVLDITGDSPTWPVWTVEGPGRDLLIQKLNPDGSEGARIFIEGDVNEPITIDTRPTIEDIYSEHSMDGQLWDQVSDDTYLFPLEPGVNQVRLALVKGNPNSEVTLRYSEQWQAGF